MSASKVSEAALRFFEDVLQKTARVIEVDRASEGDGWWALLEAVEESEFMRKYGRGDMLGIYEVNMDEKFEVTTYSRRGLKERSALSSAVA